MTVNEPMDEAVKVILKKPEYRLMYVTKDPISAYWAWRYFSCIDPDEWYIEDLESFVDRLYKTIGEPSRYDKDYKVYQALCLMKQEEKTFYVVEDLYILTDADNPFAKLKIVDDSYDVDDFCLL